MNVRPRQTNSPNAHHARRAKAPLPEDRGVKKPSVRLTTSSVIVLAVVGVVGVALLYFGITSWSRNATVDAWRGEIAEATELATHAIEVGHEQRLAEAKGPLDAAQEELDAAVSSIEGQGYDVGYYVATLDGQELFSRNADEVFYGASSIKGPFVLTTFSGGVPSGSRGLVEEAIKWSDNECYWNLRNIYGSDVLSGQLTSMGVDELTAYNSFVHLTPAQLASLWLENYWVLESSPDAEWLRSIFSEPTNSPIAALSEESYSKGGWIATESLHCTVDAGIVGHGENRYVMAAMISAGEDEELLGRLVKAIDAYEQADYTYLKAAEELS